MVFDLGLVLLGLRPVPQLLHLHFSYSSHRMAFTDSILLCLLLAYFSVFLPWVFPPADDILVFMPEAWETAFLIMKISTLIFIGLTSLAPLHKTLIWAWVLLAGLQTVIVCRYMWLASIFGYRSTPAPVCYIISLVWHLSLQWPSRLD